MINLRRPFYNPAIPSEYRSNFTHLYFDMAWYGLLAGSAVNFINVYATRLGASGLQIGLLAAMSAVVNLVLAIPAGRWIESRPIGKAVFWTSVLYRVGFLAWVFLPFFFKTSSQAEIWALIIINFLMGIPLTALGLGFNALFAASVPNRWRAYVAGIRNVVFAITFILTSLASGYILDRFPFPAGYQIVFLIGIVGGALSSLHLYFVHPVEASPAPASASPQLSSRASEITIHLKVKEQLRLDIWRTPFRAILLVFFAFHLAQYLALPIFPLYSVRALRLTDEQIGIGTAMFYFTMLIGSTQLNGLVRRFGNKNLTGVGVFGMALYPMLMAVSTLAWHYYALSAVGGFVWALVGGAYANYLLENIPENDRPAHLAWYTIILNACALLGSLSGPYVSDMIGLSAALLVFGILRGLAGFAILKWG